MNDINKNINSLLANHYLVCMITSYAYNRETKYMKNLTVGLIERINAYSITPEIVYTSQKDDTVSDDVDIIYGALVAAVGDYGTSPRFGWVDKDIAIELVGRLKDQLKIIEEQLDREKEDAAKED